MIPRTNRWRKGRKRTRINSNEDNDSHSTPLRDLESISRHHQKPLGIHPLNNHLPLLLHLTTLRAITVAASLCVLWLHEPYHYTIKCLYRHNQRPYTYVFIQFRYSKLYIGQRTLRTLSLSFFFLLFISIRLELSTLHIAFIPFLART